MDFTLDELQLAWRRVVQDHTEHRLFVVDPVAVGVHGSVQDDWLERLRTRLKDEAYAPAAAGLVEVPKGRGAIRFGTWLQLEDQVVYTACVGRLLPPIIAGTTFSPGPIDLAYQINDAGATAWLRNRFKCWDDFRRRSLTLLDSGVTTMIAADITGFYDHISLKILFSDLREAGGSEDAINLLSKCLSRWAIVDGRGIPQGISASDLLAKLYLSTVDRSLRETEICHLRYVDDFRLFCEGRPAAKRALVELSRALRRRGLSLQSAKTEILALDRARQVIDGIVPTLKPLAKNYLRQIAKAAGVSPKYLTSRDAEALLERRGISPPTEMLREAYEAFIETGDRWNSTMLHYLLGALGRAKDPYPASHALSILTEHPEETDYVLRYLESARIFTSHEGALVEILSTPDAVYPYQHFQVVRARLQIDEPPSDALMMLVRRVLRSDRAPAYLKSAAVAFVGRFGSNADLESLADTYPNAFSDAERAEIICALHRLEKSRRNGLLGQAKTDGFLVGAAADCVKRELVSKFFRQGLT